MSLILQNLRARLPATGESLLSQYECQCRDTGTKTTPEDAFAAWVRWLESNGGGPNPYKIEDWPDQYHQKNAAVIREVARYITRRSYIASAILVGIIPAKAWLHPGSSPPPTPTLGPEIAAGASLGGNQYQLTLAVNPIDTNQIAIACKTGSSETSTALLYTTDGGSTWNSHTLGGGGSTVDPSCVYDGAGNLHVFFIDGNGPGNPTGYQSSTDGGVTLSSTVDIGAFNRDHPTCGVDTTGGTYNGSVYVVGIDNSGTHNIYVSYLISGVWTTTTLAAGSIVPVSPQTGSLGGGVSAGLTVMPDGTMIFPARNSGTFITGGELQEFYALAVTGGGATINYVDVGIWNQPFSGSGPQYGFGPSNAFNKGATCYFLYTQPSSTQPTSLMMYSSTNDGASWSGPTTIYTPAAGYAVISMCGMVNNTGIIGVAFYESDTGPTLFNIKFIYSLDGGATWSAPTTVSSAASNALNAGEPRTPGQDQVYSNVDANGDFLITWTDARGAATIYTTYMRKISF